MLHLVVFMLCVFTTVSLVVVLLSGRIAYSYLKQRRDHELDRLNYYHGRLKSSISTLLAQANEIDQESRFLIQLHEDNWSHQLTRVLKDLIVLSDGVTALEFRLKSRNASAVRPYLEKSCSIAVKLARQLNAIRAAMRALKVEDEPERRK